MLTLQFIPFNEIEPLSSERRISKLLNEVKKNKVVLMQGRLRAEEEASLIQKTMMEVTKEFKGIELCTIYPNRVKKSQNFQDQIKKVFMNFFIGDREGMTIIGPANIIKEIKKNPDKIELLTHNSRKKRKTVRRK
jgi:hypothetical protein